MHPFYYSLGTFGFLEFIGDIYPGYIANEHCFELLGCNIGFYGYDGFLHFVSGICVGLGVIWAKHRAYIDRASATAFAMLSSGIAVVWEFAEWAYDLTRIHLLDMNLLVPNILTQPNSQDTVGDVILALIGTLIVYLVYSSWHSKADI